MVNFWEGTKLSSSWKDLAWDNISAGLMSPKPGSFLLSPLSSET